MVRAAKIVRRDIDAIKQSFQGRFDHSCQKDSVPILLLTLIEMIIEGPSKMHDHQEEDKEVIVRQIDLPYRGAIPLRLVSIFLNVGCVEISCGLLPTHFSTILL